MPRIPKESVTCILCGFDNKRADEEQRNRRVLIETVHGKVCGVCINILVAEELERQFLKRNADKKKRFLKRVNLRKGEKQ